MDNEAAEGGKGLVFNVLLGWETKESHMQFRETASAQEALQPLRGMLLPPVPGQSMYHVKYNAVSV